MIFKEYLDKEIQSQPTHSERDGGHGGNNTFWAFRASFEIRHLRRLSLGSADPSEYSRS